MKFLLLVLIVSCGKSNPHISDYSKFMCKVDQNNSESYISCPDGSKVVIPNAKDGSSCSVSQLVNGAKVSCTDGSFAFIYNGVDGNKGDSCTVVSKPNGATISCEDGSFSDVLNGENGLGCSLVDVPTGVLVTCGSTTAMIYDGEDAPPAAVSIVSIYDPCGKGLPHAATYGQDEVFLAFANGVILASFSDNAAGLNTRFSVLRDGVGYMTTDGSGCQFNVSTTGNTRTITTNLGPGYTLNF